MTRDQVILEVNELLRSTKRAGEDSTISEDVVARLKVLLNDLSPADFKKYFVYEIRSN